MADGSTLVGRAAMDNGRLVVTAEPRNPDESTTVALDQVKGRKAYAVSLMLAGLTNGLNGEELPNLVACLQSGGDPEHAALRE